MVPSRFGRFLTLVFAAIQFAAPAVVSVADGIVSDRVVEPRTHVEDHAQRDCVPPHSADCAACRYLADNSGIVPAVALPVSIGRAASEPFLLADTHAAAERHGFEARGPPATRG
jgi:hypothetical protein